MFANCNDNIDRLCPHVEGCLARKWLKIREILKARAAKGEHAE